MNKQRLKYIYAIIFIVVTTCISLYAHIFIMNFFQKATNFLVGSNFQGASYDFVTTVSAYVTALEPVCFLFFVYSKAGHLLPQKGLFQKSLIATIFLLGVKGYLFRQPLMNGICCLESSVGKAFFVGFLTHLHIWVSNFLLCLLTVYFFQITRWSNSSVCLRKTASIPLSKTRSQLIISDQRSSFGQEQSRS